MKVPLYDDCSDINIQWLDNIPSHWKVIRLKFAVGKRTAGPFGSSLTKDMYTSSGYRVYGQEQVIANNFTVGNYYISETKYHEMSRFAIVPNDVLVSCVGSFGKVAIFPRDAEPGIINPRLVKLSPNFSKVVPEYLEEILRSDVCFQQMQAVSRGGTMDIVNLGILSELIIPIPPLEEQRLIKLFLERETSKIDTLVAKMERLIELLQEKRQAVISHAVTKGLNPDAPMKDSEIEWLEEIPEHWEVVKLKYAMSMRGGYAFSSDDFILDGVQLIRIGNLYQNSLQLDRQPAFLPINFLKKHPGFIVRKGDILMSLTGTLGKRDYGFAILIDDNETYLLNQRVGKLTCSKNINTRYALRLLQSSVFLDQLYALPFGTKQANLSNDDVLSIEVPLPPVEEQIMMSDYIELKVAQIEQLIKTINRLIYRLREHRTALISAAVTGKIDVRGLVDEEAA